MLHERVSVNSENSNGIVTLIRYSCRRQIRSYINWAYKLFAEQCTHNVRYHSFARRVVGPWNRLPAHVDFSSLVRFKAFLNRTDLSNFLLYCVV